MVVCLRNVRRAGETIVQIGRSGLTGTATTHQLIRLASTATTPSHTSNGQISYEMGKPFESMPKAPFSLMIYKGLTDKEFLKAHVMFKYLFGKYGNILRFLVPFDKPMVFLQDPEDVQTLLASDGKMPIEPAFEFFEFYRSRMRKDLYPDNQGLLGSNGEKWHQVRTAVQQDMLRPRSATYYIQDINEISEELNRLFEHEMSPAGEVEDVTPLLYRWALESTSAIFLDSRFGCLRPNLAEDSDAQKIIDSVDIVLGTTLQEILNGVKTFRLFEYFQSKSLKKFDAASEVLYNVSKQHIAAAIEKKRSSSSGGEDELSVLEKLRARCGPESEIPLVMAMDALMAGVDTTGNTAAFLLYHLATNTECQERLYQEIMDVTLGEESGVGVSSDQLKNLKYLRACQQESQRLMPAVGGIGRLTQQPIVLSGYQVPAGTMVFSSGLMCMRNGRHFDRADQFLPERWLRGDPARHTAHPFAFLPFSHGPRMCIGRRFAELEVLVVAVRILKRFRLVYRGEGPLDMITPFTARPDGPVRIQFIPR